MNTALTVFNSSIGRKIVMSVTGLFLISFLVVHCGVNLLIYANDGGEMFEEAAEFMGTNIIIRAMEYVLFIGLIIHIVQSLTLTLQNNKARGNIKYAANSGNENSKWYSRSMGLLGTIILMFLIIHLYHFWIESRFTGREVSMFEDMQETFSHAWVVALYSAAMVSLCYHLIHGFSSSFQSLGLNHHSYTPIIKAVGLWFSIIISILFASMPIAMYLGIVK